MDDRTLQISWSWLLLPLVLILMVMGALSSPRDAQGQPLLLLPDVKANEYDALLARHVSPEHTLLNLQAATLLREVEYKVNSFPPDIHLPDGSLFRPDLVAVDANGKTFFIEVEVEANKNHEQRQAKWHNALQASGGQIYVFCDNRSCMRTIRSEINFSLADLQAGKRAADGGIWLDVRLDRSFSIGEAGMNPLV